MSLRMASPRLNRLGIYTARLWVPVDLQESIGKKEIVRSLGTRDPVLAKRLFKQVSAEIEAEWDKRRIAAQYVAEPGATKPGPRTISEREAHGLAGEFYRDLIARHGDNPGLPADWEKALLRIQRSLPERERIPGLYPFASDNDWAFHHSRNAFHAFCKEVRTFLDSRNDNLETQSFMRLCTKVALAKRDAFEQLLRNAKGDFSVDSKASRFPVLAALGAPVVEPEPSGTDPVGTEQLLLNWKTLAFPKEKTFKSWAGKLRMLMKYVGKDDVTQLTKFDVERWRDHRIASGISATTVSMGDLSGVRNVLEWAKGHTSLPSLTQNVAKDVKQKVPKNKTKLRPKSFSHEECIKILAATLVPMSDRVTQARAGSQRWVPWLCAYSGARVGEIAQMHSSRISEYRVQDGKSYWCMEITPVDGDVKDGEARIIPLHSHIIEQGFLDYAKRRQKLGKPLFYEPELRRGSGSHKQADKVGDRLGEWVRNDLKIVGVQPNHGWRHRFQTVSRNEDIREDVVDYITGHEGGDVSAKYGDYLIEALSMAIEKMPRYVVS